MRMLSSVLVIAAAEQKGLVAEMLVLLFVRANRLVPFVVVKQKEKTAGKKTKPNAIVRMAAASGATDESHRNKYNLGVTTAAFLPIQDGGSAPSMQPVYVIEVGPV